MRHRRRPGAPLTLPARLSGAARSPFAGLPREVPVLAAVAFAVAVGFGIMAPAIPLFARSFGVSRTAAGAVISVFAAMRLASALGAGRIVDGIGERLTLAIGIGLVAVSSALAGLAQSYVQLLVLRGAGGVGSAMFTVSATTLLFRSVPNEQRGRASGLFSGGFLLGGITGPALGGVVTSVSLRAPFFLYAGTLAVAGGVGLALLHRPQDAAETVTTPLPAPLSLLAAFRNPIYRAALAANLADAWGVLGVRSAVVPLFVTEGLHEGPGWTGAGFVVVAATNALVLLPAGRFADRYGRRPVLVGGCLGSGTGMVLLTLAALGIGGLGSYLLGMVVLGMGSGLLDVAPAAVVGDLLPARRGGTVVAAYQMAGDAGAVTGPLAAGRLADTVGFGAAFGLTAGVLATAAGLAAVAPETRRPASADRPAAPPAAPE